jgi:hypothetical protein
MGTSVARRVLVNIAEARMPAGLDAALPPAPTPAGRVARARQVPVAHAMPVQVADLAAHVLLAITPAVIVVHAPAVAIAVRGVMAINEFGIC